VSCEKIEMLEPSFQKCVKLAKNAEEAVKDNGSEYTIEKVTDLTKIMNYGVMMTSGLVVEGKVVSVGKVLSPDETKKLLQNVRRQRTQYRRIIND
jgi:hypothetical protein